MSKTLSTKFVGYIHMAGGLWCIATIWPYLESAYTGSIIYGGGKIICPQYNIMIMYGVVSVYRISGTWEADVDSKSSRQTQSKFTTDLLVTEHNIMQSPPSTMPNYVR